MPGACTVFPCGDRGLAGAHGGGELGLGEAGVGAGGVDQLGEVHCAAGVVVGLLVGAAPLGGQGGLALGAGGPIVDPLARGGLLRDGGGLSGGGGGFS